MSYHVKLSELNKLNRTEHERQLNNLTQAANAPVNGQLAVLDSRILQFELRYEMTSTALMETLATNGIRETAEIAEWLFLLQTRSRVTAG